MIVVSRARLEQWLDEPFFERTVGGLLARASLPVSKNRNKYLLLRILGVVDRPEGTYKYGSRPSVLWLADRRCCTVISKLKRVSHRAWSMIVRMNFQMQSESMACGWDHCEQSDTRMGLIHVCSDLSAPLLLYTTHVSV